MPAQPKQIMSVAEYLAFERAQQDKHEFYEGEIYLQAGASVAHNLITANLIALLRPQLRGRPCHVYPSDIRIKIPQRRHYVYADVSIICSPILFDEVDSETVQNPKVIIEILSPSTENYDRGRKFQAYRRIPSFDEYLLIAQDAIRVEHFVRQSASIWTMTEYTHLAMLIQLSSIDVSISMASIYEDLELDEEEEGIDGYDDHL
jgi:Uma2 family endonuclease